NEPPRGPCAPGAARRFFVHANVSSSCPGTRIPAAPSWNGLRSDIRSGGECWRDVRAAARATGPGAWALERILAASGRDGRRDMSNACAAARRAAQSEIRRRECCNMRRVCWALAIFVLGLTADGRGCSAQAGDDSVAAIREVRNVLNQQVT